MQGTLKSLTIFTQGRNSCSAVDSFETATELFTAGSIGNILKRPTRPVYVYFIFGYELIHSEIHSENLDNLISEVIFTDKMITR